MDESAPALDVSASTLELAKRLIASRSLTPDDAGCLDLIASRLEAVGFACERVDRGAVSNLWARHGHAEPIVCLAGHVDVVPTGPIERWTSDPFVPAERDGYLYGRGAADMKTSVAAMVTAAERVVAARPDHPGSIGILLTSDEEGDAVDGTVAVVDLLRERGTRLHACIVGEPTSAERLGDTIKYGRRGSLQGVLTVTGMQGHVAYPDRARNPIHAALPALTELAKMEWDGGDASFSPTRLQMSNMHAGTGAANVIPGTLEVVFNFRFGTASSVDGLQARVQEILERHKVDGEVAWTLGAEPFICSKGRLIEVLSQAVAAETGLTPALSTSGGTSDARFLAGISTELAEFGPLNASSHAIDECVRVADIGPLSLVYEQTVAALLTR
ncbi:MAG: succinyl-diaminopimelate desuccinylase [Acidobacteria bacterium]|nr:succinyl-diaminopimelate desuccinylase [Acidobacteriota bacterium]